MMKLLRLFPLLCISCAALSAEPDETPAPLDPAYMGEHEMVLVANGSHLMASVMPGYQKPNNVQIVYSLNSKNPALTHLVRDAELVTARSTPFNLQRLIRGESVKTTLDVYMGHLHQGGMLTYEDVSVTLDQQLYVRSLDDIEPAGNLRKYVEVPLRKGKRLMIHQIQLPPSYDHLILFHEDISCITEFISTSPVPAENEVLSRLTYCGSMTPLYYDSLSLN